MLRRMMWTLLFAVVSLANVASAQSVSGNYQGLWWNPNESGWGISFAHQGEVIFATWFTYDTAGKPWWLIASLKRSENEYKGDVYTVAGPAFNSTPWLPANVRSTSVGTMAVAFVSGREATLTYTVNGVVRTTAIRKQLWGMESTCVWGAQPDLSKATNYTDMWWNASESGWGIHLTQQSNTIYATWFTYDANGQPWWLAATMKPDVSGSAYVGDIVTVAGSPFGVLPWDPSRGKATTVGTMAARFVDGNHGNLTYTVNGVTQTKAITREVFASPGTTCTEPIVPRVDPAAPVSVTLTAAPQGVYQGDTIALTWTSTNATSCWAGASWKGNNLPPAGTHGVLVRAFGVNKYSITCTNGNPATVARATLDVTTKNPYAQGASIPAGKHRLARVDYRYDQTNFNSNGDVITHYAAMVPFIDQIKSVGFSGVLLQLQTPINLQTGLVAFDDGPYFSNGEHFTKTPPKDLWRIVEYAQAQGLAVWFGLQIVDSIDDMALTAQTAYGPKFSMATMFASAITYQTDIARQAQEHGVQGIYVSQFNTGIDREYKDHWQGLINSIRTVFKGKLTYVGSASADVVLWPMVDYVGIYFKPRLSTEPVYDLAALVDLYESNSSGVNWVRLIRDLAATTNKPIFLDYQDQLADPGVGVMVNIYDAAFSNISKVDPSLAGIKPNYAASALRFKALFEQVNNKLSDVVDGVDIDSFSPWTQDPDYFSPSNPFFYITFYSWDLYNNPRTLSAINQYLSKPWGHHTIP